MYSSLSSRLSCDRRIIQASSNESDVVLDPFCGCGTAISVAQRLSRRWIGIDVTHLAIGLIKKRLADAFGDSVRETYEIIGEPVDLPGAETCGRRSVSIPVVGIEFGWGASAGKEERREPGH
ncbi:MAG: hypothetical protein DMG96_22935 [Acidobacteria bacterium]|nr:MAG: hypothetical protein DMG96_22935 [Acidobacteriota bacterium]